MNEKQKEAITKRGYQIPVCSTCKSCGNVDRGNYKEYFCENDYVISMMEPYLEGEIFVYVNESFGCNQWEAK